MHARLTIGGKNPGELTVRMEMALPHGMVSNGGGGGGGKSCRLEIVESFFC